MSHSPDGPQQSGSADYTEGWAAIIRMIREGGSWSGHERNCAFVNTGDGRFSDVSAASGLDFSDDARAAAVTDWDLDGDLDLWVANRTSPRLRFMRNDAGEGQRFVALRLEGREGNRDAVGARAELMLDGSAGKRLLVRALRAGEGYLAQSSKWLHFGLGESGSIESLVVRWPDGSRESFDDIKPDRRYTLIEGSGAAADWTPPERRVALTAETVEPLAVPGRARIVLASRPPMPRLEVLDFDGTPASLQGLAGKPYVLNLWARWCAACVEELQELAERSADFDEKEVKLVLLNVDEPDARSQAHKFIAGLGAEFTSVVATESSAEVLDVLQKTLIDERVRIALPTSFLVDASGRLVSMYRGAVEPDRLLEDLQLVTMTAAELRDAAVMFEGRWYGGPPRAPVDAIAKAYVEAGHEQLASALLARSQGSSDATVAQVQFRSGMTLKQQGKQQEALDAFRRSIEAGRRVLERDPADPVMSNNLGVTLTEVGRCSEAVDLFLRAAPGHPDPARVQANLARCYTTLNRHDDAIAALREAARLNPDQPAYQRILDQYLVQMDRNPGPE